MCSFYPEKNRRTVGFVDMGGVRRQGVTVRPEARTGRDWAYLSDAKWIFVDLSTRVIPQSNAHTRTTTIGDSVRRCCDP